jgi:hypothetical protein
MYLTDYSSDSDTESEYDPSIEEEDPSIADQKVTAVNAVIETATEDQPLDMNNPRGVAK